LERVSSSVNSLLSLLPAAIEATKKVYASTVRKNKAERLKDEIRDKNDDDTVDALRRVGL